MWIDPIVEEVRKARMQYIKKFKYEFPSIFADLKQKEQLRAKQGWEIVKLPLYSQTKNL